ncbi:zinc-ribbon domain-containing protein [Polymorphobacter fuscus]|uniref:Zinc finger/thioredoxin putative domain-containing protein n=1 Tax=Sandarakinorhabdus fusca TaxID=1439888 RepID=A0A7C9GQJ1_9SPHN|nr:zinc-ribbon domain-containing protein [Polymorphobacter fuscus]KAB7646473.1 hypothetical protein F9290_10630 [Polymorphobacter fuscus]MQT17716.1 hypothetical protein [Polymorphobacter fuscus]NJC09736.1 putative Zn finger-like uncharacterized protein [Polymorphobacter fuscus]
MIITCPNCSARYRLAAPPVANHARMRCAACNHRWVPGVDEPEELPSIVDMTASPPPATAAPVAETSDGGADDTGGEDDSGDDADAPATESPAPVLHTVVAVLVGLALAVAAGALWVARIDPETLPVVGDRIAALTPRALPLAVTVTAHVTPMPSGDRLLEIAGKVRNTGTMAVTLPDLEARLAGPEGTVRRWRIAAPVRSLQPGQTVDFVSTATGFPASATLVGIRPGR